MDTSTCWAVYSPEQDGKKFQLSLFVESHSEALGKAERLLDGLDFPEVWVCSHDENGNVLGEYKVARVA